MTELVLSYFPLNGWSFSLVLSFIGCKSRALTWGKAVTMMGNQFWIFTGRTDAEAETPVLWPPDVKNWLIWKDPDAGEDWRQEEKGTTEDEMVGWHHWLDGHEFEQAPGVGDGQGSLACYSPWGHKELDMTEWLNWTWWWEEAQTNSWGKQTQEENHIERSWFPTPLLIATSIIIPSDVLAPSPKGYHLWQLVEIWGICAELSTSCRFMSKIQAATG